MARALGNGSDLARLTDAELDARLQDAMQGLIDSYARDLDRFSLPAKADQAEAELRKWVALGEQAARAIAGRMAPRQEEMEE